MVSADALVYVVDDDPAVLDAIRLLLRSVGLRSQTFESAAAFLDAFDRDQHGCLVLDVRMPSMSGIDLQEKLQEIGATIPIVFVTAHGDIPMAVQAVKAGALDFIPKPFRDQDLLDRVQQAIAIDTQQRREQEEKLSVSARYNALSPREREVLELVVAGKANKVIARELDISEATVKAHLSSVLRTLGVNNRTEAVYAAAKLGLQLV